MTRVSARNRGVEVVERALGGEDPAVLREYYRPAGPPGAGYQQVRRPCASWPGRPLPLRPPVLLAWVRCLCLPSRQSPGQGPA